MPYPRLIDLERHPSSTDTTPASDAGFVASQHVPELEETDTSAAESSNTTDADRFESAEMTEPELAVAEPEIVTPQGVSLVTATRALFFGLALLVIAAGLFGTAVGVRSELNGFSALELGLVSSAYFAGFVVGSHLTVGALIVVGHIRVYTALAGTMAAAIIATGYLESAPFWIGLRFVVGLCLAGLYVVAESWLNRLVGNDKRGRLLTSYLLLTTVAYAIGQWSSGLWTSDGTGVFAAAAILTCLAIAPVALSEEARPPFTVNDTRVSIRQLWHIAPTGLVTSSLVGLAHGAFLGLEVMYATRAGLSVGLVGAFVAMPTVGNTLLAMPSAAVSDRADRRVVGGIGAALAALAAIGLALTGPLTWGGWASMVVIGATSFPLYSVAGAYTNDHVPEDMMGAAASMLVMLFGVGAAIGPMVGSLAMATLGNSGFAWTVAFAHLAIAGFLAVRVLQYPTAVRARPDRAVAFDSTVHEVPATAVGAGRRIRLARPRRPSALRSKKSRA